MMRTKILSLSQNQNELMMTSINDLINKLFRKQTYSIK